MVQGTNDTQLNDEQVRLEFHNLMTGEKRHEIWKKVETNIADTYLAPNGRYYTKGVIGWMDVTAFAVTPFTKFLQELGRELGYNPDYVAPKKHNK